MRPDASLPPRAATRTEGAAFRRASSGVSDDPAVEIPDDIQRWTARRRTALVLSILKGEMTVEEVAGRHGLAVSEVEEWKERLLAAAHNALRSRPRDEDALRDEQIRRLKQKVGELVLEVDQLREAMRSPRAASPEEVDE
jgi:transposase-like protein